MPRNIFYNSKNVLKSIQPNIGLETAARLSVVEMLNFLMADEAVLMLKTSRADGQAGDKDALNLQPFYDAQYKQIKAIGIDIAERIRILGGSPLSDSKELMVSVRLDGRLAEDPEVMSILAAHEAVVRCLREDAKQCSEEYEDVGTSHFLVNILCQHERMAWMLRSYTDLDLPGNESQGSKM
jgi:starvation-inducible DNA-binding protein